MEPGAAVSSRLAPVVADGARREETAFELLVGTRLPVALLEAVAHWLLPVGLYHDLAKL